MAKVLLVAEDNSLISIWDCTYIYIEKSSSYEFQRATFSGHKHRNLLKWNTVNATDGTLIEVKGPYICNGSNNDAAILESILESNINDLDDYFKEEDVFVVDRGYRDALDYLEEKKLFAKMPSYLKGTGYLSFLLYRDNFFLPKVLIIYYKYFSDVVINKNIESLDDDFRNICAQINRFRPPLASTDDEERKHI